MADRGSPIRCTWSRHRWAIVGLALALLLHVTVFVAAVYGIYRLLELAVSSPEGASPSANTNLEASDTSEGMYLPAE